MNRFVSLGAFLALFVVVQAGVPEHAPICRKDNHLELYPDITDCSRYFRCEHNYPVLHQCPENLLYDPSLKTCNWEHNVVCMGGGQVVPPKEPVKTCPAREDEQRPTHLPHPTDCSKFYKCWNGVPQLQDCPAGQLWNQDMVACDYAADVVCNLN